MKHSALTKQLRALKPGTRGFTVTDLERPAVYRIAQILRESGVIPYRISALQVGPGRYRVIAI